MSPEVWSRGATSALSGCVFYFLTRSLLMQVKIEFNTNDGERESCLDSLTYTTYGESEHQKLAFFVFDLLKVYDCIELLFLEELIRQLFTTEEINKFGEYLCHISKTAKPKSSSEKSVAEIE
jgi:hypothetical protein